MGQTISINTRHGRISAWQAKPHDTPRGALIVVQEILQDKIFLDNSGEVRARGPSAGEAARRAMLTDISDSGGGDD